MEGSENTVQGRKEGWKEGCREGSEKGRISGMNDVRKERRK